MFLPRASYSFISMSISLLSRWLPDEFDEKGRLIVSFTSRGLFDRSLAYPMVCIMLILYHYNCTIFDNRGVKIVHLGVFIAMLIFDVGDDKWGRRVSSAAV